jgi:signal transduction histidine kinase
MNDTLQSHPLTPEILTTRLGEYLVEKGRITPKELNRALEIQDNSRKNGESVKLTGQILIDINAIDRQTLDSAITEQILQLRTALLESNQKLEQRVKERTAALETAMRKLSEANQIKANFVSNVSHELRTPLTHIKGYLDLLSSEDLGPLNLSQAHAIRTMQRSSDRLERLIEDLIQYSIVEKGEITLFIKPFNIEKLALRMVERCREVAQTCHIHLDISSPPNLPDVFGDEDKIGWVIYQLLDNAIKFTHEEGCVTLSLEREDRFIRVSINDNGIGIQEDRIPEIFEAFHQLDSSSTRRYAGTGIGLALVKRILEAHGSIINVTTEIGKGSNFYFLLGTEEIITAVE